MFCNHWGLAGSYHIPKNNQVVSYPVSGMGKKSHLNTPGYDKIKLGSLVNHELNVITDIVWTAEFR